MERWGDVDNPLVKTVAGLTVPLFLAVNFPAAFFVLVGGIMFYSIALVGVAHAYRRRYRIVGRPELAAQIATRTLAAVKGQCNSTISRSLEMRKKHKSLQQEKEARLKHYRRERNRRKREQARGLAAQQR